MKDTKWHAQGYWARKRWGWGAVSWPPPPLHRRHPLRGREGPEDLPQEVRFRELSPPLCSEGESPRRDRRARWATGQRRRQTEAAMAFRRQTAALGNAALCRPHLVAHSPFSHLKKNTGNLSAVQINKITCSRSVIHSQSWPSIPVFLTPALVPFFFF